MRDTRVLVVDDSAAMRALFSGILENAKGVEVCGVASSAAEARDMITDLKPDVLTLDVEMPVMTGMEFLEEIMEERPMPVIMLSSIAQAGSGTATKALELGAVHCFPKPLRTTPEEFDATVAKLGDIVIRAANGELNADNDDASAGEEAGPPFESDGSIVVMACGEAGLEPLKAIVSSYPANCPPTVAVIDADRPVVEAALAELQKSAKCTIAEASDSAVLEEGKVYFAFEKSAHLIVEAGPPPKLRIAARDPVAGCRPSADLLLGSIARAQVRAHAGLLSGTGSDGAKGLQILMKVGGNVFLEDPAQGAPRARLDAVHALGIAAADMPAAELCPWILQASGQK